MGDVVMDINLELTRSPSCAVKFSDFANMLKAFVGSNYLTTAYAFTQSGLVPGIIGLIFIASVTDHCCHLIVECKRRAIAALLDKHKTAVYGTMTKSKVNGAVSVSNGVVSNGAISSGRRSSGSSDCSNEDSNEEMSTELASMRRKLIRSMTYGDVGRVACGGPGLLIVNICLIFTQFGFCVGYFIFLGNTMYHLFPYRNETLEYIDTPSVNKSSLLSGLDSHDIHERSADVSNGTESFVGNMMDLLINLTTTILPSNLTTAANMTTTILPTNLTTAVNMTTTPAFTNVTTTFAPTTSVPVTSVPMFNFSHFVGISTAPDLRMLVISPLPFFVGFAFLRDVRHLGFVSVAADVAIFVGCVLTLIILNVGFTLSDSWHMYELMKFPVFFGMVTSSFEGIGTIIPIEASMEGNRHNFGKFLHGAVFIISAILLIFGVLGYLRYGDETAQMINKNMPDGTVGVIINICLCIGVVLTFPLQIYPVIELTEIYLFGNGRICGPSSKRYKKLRTNDDGDDDNEETGVSEEHESLNEALLSVESPIPVAATISDEVSTWKRNLLRIVLVIAAGGVAIVLRDLYAYVSAFIGAVGSSALAYILPCMFHFKLCRATASRWVLVKDVVIIVFGIFASIISLYSTMKSVVEHFS